MRADDHTHYSPRYDERGYEDGRRASSNRSPPSNRSTPPKLPTRFPLLSAVVVIQRWFRDIRNKRAFARVGSYSARKHRRSLQPHHTDSNAPPESLREGEKEMVDLDKRYPLTSEYMHSITTPSKQTRRDAQDASSTPSSRRPSSSATTSSSSANNRITPLETVKSPAFPPLKREVAPFPLPDQLRAVLKGFVVRNVYRQAFTRDKLNQITDLSMLLGDLKAEHKGDEEFTLRIQSQLASLRSSLYDMFAFDYHHSSRAHPPRRARPLVFKKRSYHHTPITPHIRIPSP
jgi:hypothetical protein